MTVLCDTGQVAATERFELWSQSLSASFFPLRVECPEPADFNGRLEGFTLGPLQLFHATADACAPVRTAACVAADDPEQLQVHLLRDGRCRISQDERATETTPGDITLLVSSRPFTVRATAPHDLLIFSIPLWLLGPYADRLIRSTATRTPGHDGLAAWAGPFLSSLADGLQAGAVAEDDDALADAVVALTRAVHGASSSSIDERHETPDALLAQVKCYIERHLHEPDISPASIAAAHFISTRYLHKLFEAEETTVSRWIQRRRLERCYEDLTDPAFAGKSIAAIAARWGFRNRDVLTRLLRTTYGVVPRELRSHLLSQGDERALALHGTGLRTRRAAGSARR